MASEVRHFKVSTPAGTTSAAPLVSDLTMPARVVERVRFRVPPGPQGSLGFQLGSSRQQVLPWNAGEWFVLDDEELTLDLDNQISSGAWQLISYNTGTYPHAVYVTFYLRPPQSRALDDLGQIILPPGYPSGGGTTPPDDGGGGDGGGGGTTPPTYDDGYAAGRLAARVALAIAYGDDPPATAPVRPDAGTTARTGWDAAVSAALDALEAITDGPAPPPPPDVDGAALASVNALAAVQVALGVAPTVTPGSTAGLSLTDRAEYDARRGAILAALGSIREA
mgnify:CR=1 FL=1